VIDFTTLGIGDELPVIEVTPSYMDLVVYAGTSRDYFEIHHDRDAARAAGHPDVIVQGSLKAGWLGRVVTGPLGDQGALRRLTVQYRGVDTPDHRVTGHGIVRDRRRDGDDLLLEFDLWLANDASAKTVTGSAVVAVAGGRGRIG
jgi:acyl dehydratase